MLRFISGVLPTYLIIILIALFVLSAIYAYQIAPARPWPQFPLVSLPGLNAAESWKNHAYETIALGRATTGNGFFQIITGNGPKIVVPNRFLEEIRANKDLDALKGLDAQKAFSNDHFWWYSGMIGFRAMRHFGAPIRHVVRGKVNAAMLAMTTELVSEADMAIADAMPLSKTAESEEWRSVRMQPVCEEIVARLATLLFLGRDSCRDRQWLEIGSSYALNGFRASARLRACSPIWRPLGHRFVFPESKTVRKQCAEAERKIRPMIEKREQMIAAGEYKSLKVGDTLGWLLEASQRYQQHIDCVGAQMLLMLGAVGDTTETLNSALYDICRHPEVVQPLREEMFRVLEEEGGWNKNVFPKLQLMDSFLKESQRMTPGSIVPARRLVTRRTVLSDGTVLPKGAIVTFAGQNMDPVVFPEPEKFDLYRFLRLRGQGYEGAQYSAQSVSMIQFGYGAWACPGRFLAGTILKIALVLFLTTYDFRLDKGCPEYIRFFAGTNMSNLSGTIEVRRKDKRGMAQR